jgi:hypothetical protein
MLLDTVRLAHIFCPPYQSTIVHCHLHVQINIKWIVSRDFDTLFRFHWIDLKVVIGPDQVYFSF